MFPSIVFGAIKIFDLVKPDVQYTNGEKFLKCYKLQDEGLKCWVQASPEEITGFMEDAIRRRLALDAKSFVIISPGLKEMPSPLLEHPLLQKLDLSQTDIDLTKPGNIFLKNLIREKVWQVRLPKDQVLSTGKLTELSDGEFALEGHPLEVSAFLHDSQAVESLARAQKLAIKSPTLLHFPLEFVVVVKDQPNLKILDVRETGIKAYDKVIPLLEKANPQLQILVSDSE